MTTSLWRYLRISAASLLLLILFPYHTAAQISGDTAKALTLEDALNYALQHYPAVRASLEQVSAARAGVTLARTQYLPQLSGVYQDSRATQNQVPGIWLPTADDADRRRARRRIQRAELLGQPDGAFFSWEPIDFGLRPAMVALARSAQDKSNADLAVTRLQVAAAVGELIFDGAGGQQAVTAAQANVDRWQVFNQSVHTLVDNDLRPGADASRADAQLALAKTQLYQAQQAEQAALATLAALMGTAGS